jgi:hypothetical protein
VAHDRRRAPHLALGSSHPGSESTQLDRLRTAPVRRDHSSPAAAGSRTERRPTGSTVRAGVGRGRQRCGDPRSPGDGACFVAVRASST